MIDRLKRAAVAAVVPSVPLALALVLAAPPAPARSAAPPAGTRFVEHALDPIGEVTDRVIRDLDGDGRKDLILIAGREVRTYFQRAGGLLGPASDQRFVLDPRTVIFDVADLEPDGRAEIVAIAEDGVFLHRLEGRLFSLGRTPLLRGGTLLRRSSGEEARRTVLCRDLDGDGPVDILLPRAYGYEHRRNEGGGSGRLGLPGTIPVPLGAAVDVGQPRLSSRLTHSFWFPEPVMGDVDGDGRAELVVPQPDHILAFPMREDGTIAPRPSLRLAVPEVKARAAGSGSRFDLDFDLPLRIADVNGDGILDVTTTRVGQGATRIYLGRPGGAPFERPDRVVRTNGVTFFHFMVDLDRDGRLDLILPRVDSLGILSILEVLVSGELEVEAYFFYGRDEGVYPAEPDLVREFSVPIEIHSTSDGLTVGSDIVATVLGDHDGDGVNDLLLKTEPTTLAVFPGSRERTIAEDPAFEIEVASIEGYRFCEPVIEDWNDDGRDDILLIHYGWDRDDDRVSLVLSARDE